MRSRPWLLALAMILWAGGERACAQRWRDIAGPAPRRMHAMVYDIVNARTLLFGGSDMTETFGDVAVLDGNGWHHLSRAPFELYRRDQHALAYDMLRQRTVLFGGSLGIGDYRGDTWEHDGTRWKPVTTPLAPSARCGHMMVFDPTHAVTVLFGGDTAAGLQNDTWLFDGRQWTPFDPPHSPPARSYAGMVHDLARQRTVVFSGLDPTRTSAFLDDTWEFDGADWREAVTTNRPPPRAWTALAYDLPRGRTVMFGGGWMLGTALLDDTWEYDGIDWHHIQTQHSPSPRAAHALAFDLQRNRTVLFGGDGTNRLGDTWEYDGTDWTERTLPPAPPRSVDGTATYDAARGRIVQMMQDRRVWELGARWSEGVSMPADAQKAAAVFDRARERIVHFGGVQMFWMVDATTEFDGQSWRIATPPHRPPPRMWHAMAYDATRRRTVLFGGIGDVAPLLGDTWEYDGLDWRQVRTTIAPAARCLHAMTFDAGRDRVLLFGGGAIAATVFVPEPLYDDTWQFDGVDWLPVVTPSRPAPRSGHTLVYDPVRGATLLTGGTADDRWLLTARDWTRVVAHDDIGLHDGAAVYDEAHARVVLVFGSAGETWELPQPDAASFARYGRGCAGSAGTPSLDAAAGALPVLGAPFALDLASLPPQPGLALLMFGFDLVRWNGQLLPVDLASLGLAGCDLWLAPIATFALAHGGGSLRHTLAIPNDPRLRGTIVGAQAFTLDAAAPSGVGGSSNGAILRLW